MGLVPESRAAVTAATRIVRQEIQERAEQDVRSTSDLTINGNLLVTGEVDIGDTGGGNYALDVAGDAHAVSFPTSSDRRLKRNIQPLPDGLLAVVKAITPVSFRWNEYQMQRMVNKSRAGDIQIGFVAQDIEEAIPQVVTHWRHGHFEDLRAIDYSRLTAVLFKAVQELAAQVEALEARVETLEAA